MKVVRIQLNIWGNPGRKKRNGIFLILKSDSLVTETDAKWSTNQSPDLAGTLPTEDGSGRNGLFVDPEGNLSEDDGHDAGDVGLNQEETHLPLQMEVNGHDDVFPCRRQTGSQEGLRDTRAALHAAGNKTPVNTSAHRPGHSMRFCFISELK